ncbi:PA0069 family radical SAM protein [Croceibacterium ferulae]|uniref:PA0069 family radical SAM protein n=1 Tax=Croceibacterium ferulae TaxID=1854641 RepID=UPI000EB12CD7|nr:PA0069 family radical SAM protein [Croceibacterium ferulae]
MPDKPPSKVHGRGAQSAELSQRFAAPQRSTDGDWRDHVTLLDGPPVKLRTTVTAEHARSILSFNSSPDIGFDRSVNAYRGCEHGCIYCFARPTHAYHDLSPGLDFETRLFAKPDAARLLRQALARRGYVPRPIAMGTNTDPYQPIERDWRLTRDLLQVCLEAHHPVTITTKSDRVLADLDLLRQLAERQLTAVAISVTTLDPRLAALLEPRAPAPARRLAALGRLQAAGVPVHCAISPIIPAITDDGLEAIIARVAEIGVLSVGYIPLRLPHELAPLFREWLAVHFPDRAAKVMNIVRSMRGGRDNDPAFFTRMRPQGTWAQLLKARFGTACRRAGLQPVRFALDCSGFTVPSHWPEAPAQRLLL